MDSGAAAPVLRGTGGLSLSMTSRSRPSRLPREVATVAGGATTRVDRSVISRSRARRVSTAGFASSSSSSPMGVSLQLEGLPQDCPACRRGRMSRLATFPMPSAVQRMSSS
jgi:hypothetical protein